MTFEQNLARLEAIVAELEGEELDLDRALKLFEEGVAELRAASAELAKADAGVKRLIEGTDGAMEVVDFRA